MRHGWKNYSFQVFFLDQKQSRDKKKKHDAFKDVCRGGEYSTAFESVQSLTYTCLTA